MRFRIGSHLLDADVQYPGDDGNPPGPTLGERAALPTGHLLIRFRVTGAETQAVIVDLLQESWEDRGPRTGLVASTPEGGFGGVWQVVDAAYTVTRENGQEVYWHLWEIAESPSR